MSLRTYLPLVGVAVVVAYFAGVAHSNGEPTPSRKDVETVAPVAASSIMPIVPDSGSIRSAAIQWINDWKVRAKPSYAPSFHANVDVSDATADFTMSDGDLAGDVRDIHGAVADVEVKYGLPSSDNGAVVFQIDGELRFVHGRSGWVDGSEWWSNRKILGFRAKNGSMAYATDSKIIGDQTIEYTLEGTKYTWTRLSHEDWKIATLETASPTSQPIALQPTPTVGGTSYGSTSGGTGQSSQYAPPATVPEDSSNAGCEEADVNAVYDDGKVLELDDGRHLRVDDVDSVTSSVWVAPFDGLICDNGDKFIDKDDNESVELEP